MSRFNFSAYVARNSLTDFNSYYDLDPQGEWEAKNRERLASQHAMEPVDVAEPKSRTESEEYDFKEDLYHPKEFASEVESEDLGLPRETSELLERVASANPGENFFDIIRSTKPKEPKAQSNYLDHKGSFTQNTFQLDKSLFDDLDGIDFGDTRGPSSQTQTRDRQMVSPTPEAAENADRPLLLTSKPTSPVPGFSDWSPRGSSTPSQRSSATPTPRPSAASTPRSSAASTPAPSPRPDTDLVQRETNTFSPRPGIDLLYPGGKPKLILSLDDHDTLQPIRTKEEVNRILVEVDGEQLPSTHPNIAEAIGKMRRYPINEISHYSTIGQYFGVLREEGKCTDVTIRIGSRVFTAHRIAIACFSEFFADLLFRKNDQKQTIPVNIHIQGIDPQAFQSFLDFVYTGKIRITPDIIGDLHTMAERLRIPKLKIKCAEFIDTMPLEYALSLLKSTKLTPEHDIYQCAVEVVCEQFARASKSRGFLDLDVEIIFYILSQNQLNITSEREVFVAGLNWIEHAFNQRKGYTERIMECVRFPYMTQEELFGCMHMTDLFNQNEKCKQMILKANWIISARNMGVDDPLNFAVQGPRQCLSLGCRRSDVFFSAHSFLDSDINISIEQEDTPTSKSTPVIERRPTTDDILAVGEFNENPKAKKNKPTPFFERYITRENNWKHQTSLPEPLSHYGAATLSGKLYVTGGYNPETMKKKTPIPTKEAYVLDTQTNEWKQIAPMNTARMYHSLCSLYGMVYAIGGQDEKKRVLNSVECYNPITDNWFYVKEMPTARLGTGVAVKDGKMFVAGGYGDTADKKTGMPILSTMEAYNPRTNTWERLNDLRFPRCHASMVTVNGQIYICGGATRVYTNKDYVLASDPSIDVYDEEYDTWEHHTDMAIARHNAGTTVVGGKIYLIGGISTVNNTVLNSIECFDVRRNEWINGVRALPYPGEWLHCVAIPSKE